MLRYVTTWMGDRRGRLGAVNLGPQMMTIAEDKEFLIGQRKKAGEN